MILDIFNIMQTHCDSDEQDDILQYSTKFAYIYICDQKQQGYRLAVIIVKPMGFNIFSLPMFIGMGERVCIIKSTR